MATGDVIFVPPAIHRTFCPINFGEWPWGQQNCSLTFGSWTYHQGNVDIVPYESSSDDMEAIDTKYFVNSRVGIFDTFCAKRKREKLCKQIRRGNFSPSILIISDLLSAGLSFFHIFKTLAPLPGCSFFLFIHYIVSHTQHIGYYNGILLNKPSSPSFPQSLLEIHPSHLIFYS